MKWEEGKEEKGRMVRLHRLQLKIGNGVQLFRHLDESNKEVKEEVNTNRIGRAKY